jgi:mono/diheme cytochrome c family protein
VAAIIALASIACSPAGAAEPENVAVSPLPARLSGTGLYVSGSTREVRPEHLFFVPQYPLWSDGAAKKRWLSLPAGARIDASDPDAWVFPVGTRLWKEFSFGERTETRYIERLADGSYRYATYVWDAAAGDAVLAPAGGVPGVRSLGAGLGHDIPSTADCLACHEGRRSPVLGFNALQLSPDRDPLAAHAEPLTADVVDLPELVRRDLISGLPPALIASPPRIAAPAPTTRAAAGYLFGNCASCHNAEGPLAGLGLDFDQSVLDGEGHARLRSSALGRASKFRLPGEEASRRALPGQPERSSIWFRMQARDPIAQMPPLGSKLVDHPGVDLVAAWISRDLQPDDRK